MTHNPPNHYEPQELTERKNSPEFHALVFRNPETEAKENIMQDFLSFAEDEFDMTEKELEDLKSMVNLFVGYDNKKAEQGEKAMLARWLEAVK